MVHINEYIGSKKAHSEGNEAEMPLQLPLADGWRSAEYDPTHHRLKLYGVLAPDLEDPDNQRAVDQLLNESDVFSKLLVYSFQGHEKTWSDMGFKLEAVIKNFYSYHLDAYVWVANNTQEREERSDQEQGDNLLTAARSLASPPLMEDLEGDIRIATPADAYMISERLARSPRRDFVATDPTEIASQIGKGESVYMMLKDKDSNATGKCIAVVAARLDRKRKTAEIIHFEYDDYEVSRNTLKQLVRSLERYVRTRHGISDFYASVISDRFSSNGLFADLEYEYTGRLLNNYRIDDEWQSANIWCRSFVASKIPANLPPKELSGQRSLRMKTRETVAI